MVTKCCFIVFALPVLFYSFGIAHGYDGLIVTTFNVSLHQLTKTLEIPPNMIMECYITDIPSNVSFMVFQAHSHLYRVSMTDCFNPSVKLINGSNLGLVFNNDGVPYSTYCAQILNNNMVQVDVLAGLVAYPKSSPVPGGCNTEFPLAVAPFLELTFDSAMVTVDGALAGVQSSTKCPQPKLSYELYYTFMPERDFSKETYFSFMSLGMSGATSKWSLASQSATLPPLRRVFSAYKGTGVVFNFKVSTPSGNSSFYVPIHTYACNYLSATDPCSEFSGSSFVKVVLVLLFIGGLVLIIGGHVTFGYELIVIGSIFGSLVTFVVCKRADIVYIDQYVESLLIGISCGLLWASIWWILRIPILSVSLPLFCYSLFISCVVMPVFMGIFSVFESDTNYWTTFFAIAALVFCVFLANTVEHNIRACSVIGTYAVLIPVDYYCGTGWKYLVINVLRRATVKGFNVALMPYVFQVPDIILFVAFCVIAFSSVKGQKAMSRGRAPYPAPCRILPPLASESTPLLS